MPNDRQRVVWYEGMTLDPHHFQQWDRYYESVLQSRVRAVAPYDWGLTELVVDRERLANGEFVLVRCTGVMPDGLVVDMPQDEPLPAPRNVQEVFSTSQERLGVYLAVPARRPGSANTRLPGAERRRETRHVAQTISFPDDNTGTDERQIEVGQPSLSVRFEGESLEAYTTLPIAMLRREVSGGYVLDERFVPPCLGLGGSDRLQTLAGRLVELLLAKSTSLAERRRGVLQQRDLSPGDLASVGLLSAINAHLPVLKHYAAQPGTHPERLYLTLVMLVGQLSAYLPESDAATRELPGYDHGRPEACFNRLDAVLRDMLGEARPQANYLQLPLQRQRENLYSTAAQPDVLQEAQLFLVARSEHLGENELVQALPMKLRVAAPSNIEAVLRSYTRALPIEHTHRLPVGMPVDPQANYFQLMKRGPFWESICQDEGIAVFVPSELSQVQLQMIAVKG